MKKVKVNKELCIRCRACMDIASDVFKEDAEGYSEPRVSEVNDDNKNAIDAMESCPTGAITLEDEGDCECEQCECEHCDCHHEE